jgi:Putative zinc-finger/TAT (twin-arginine translocation) pathway signal sequence
MVITCQEVWREISNYLDGEIESGLRAAIDEHVRGCQRCAAVLDGTRNVIQLYGDERMLEVPLGFSQRLHRRLDEQIPQSRRTFLGWLVAAAAAALVAGAIELARLSVWGRPDLRSQMAHRGTGVPGNLVVVVAEDGRLFHLAGCPFIHEKDKLRTMTAAQATHDGYTACPRCLKKYLVSI